MFEVCRPSCGQGVARDGLYPSGDSLQATACSALRLCLWVVCTVVGRIDVEALAAGDDFRGTGV